eukprot:COSAG01_NODE_165_length_23303_cov_269.524953_21_plen_312_part_00
MTNHLDNFSFIIMRPDGKASVQWQASKSLLYCLLICFVLVSSLILGVGYHVFNSKNKIRDTHLSKIAIKKQAEDLQVYNHKIDQLALDIEYLLAQEKDLNLLLGNIKKRKRKKKKLTSSFKRKYRRLQRQRKSSVFTQVDQKIKLMDQTLANSRRNIRYLEKNAQRYKARFASIPSIWPTYGPLLSKYGYRRHPLTKKKQFHKGIDIASRNGSPIKSTADGRVEFSGWARGFGNTVVINHGFGYRTIYAHCSLLKAVRAQKVKKGEVIAFVGSTGRSTGPHLHYEVRRWHKSLQPKTFLDLNMFTASRKVW